MFYIGFYTFYTSFYMFCIGFYMFYIGLYQKYQGTKTGWGTKKLPIPGKGKRETGKGQEKEKGFFNWQFQARDV